MKIDWKQKLSSRKFLVFIAGFITGLIIRTGASPESVTEIIGSVMSGVFGVGYMFAEGLADSKRSIISMGEVINLEDNDKK